MKEEVRKIKLLRLALRGFDKGSVCEHCRSGHFLWRLYNPVNYLMCLKCFKRAYKVVGDSIPEHFVHAYNELQRSPSYDEGVEFDLRGIYDEWFEIPIDEEDGKL